MSAAEGFTPPPLPLAAQEALLALPAAVQSDVATIRRVVLAKEARLGTTMRRVERLAVTWPGEVLIEFWAWLAYLTIVLGYRADTTCDVYANATGRFLGWCVQEGIDHTDVSLQQFDAWQKWLFFDRQNSARHRGKQLCGVRSFYAWRSSRMGGRNCAVGVKAPRVEDRMPRKYSSEELRRMLEHTAYRRPHPLPVRDRAMLLFLLATGARREEVPRVDLDHVQLRTNTGVVRILGKGSREREIPIEGPVVHALQEWLLERDRLALDKHPTAVFVGVNPRWCGRRLSTYAVEQAVSFAARRAGLKDWGVHRFRITFATSLYDEGHGIEEIRIVMGHRKIETTRRYLSVSERARRTRLSSNKQHEVLGTRNGGQPRWVQAALGRADQ